MENSACPNFLRSVSELTQCTCSVKLELVYYASHHFTNCAMHKGRYQHAATRISNVEDRIESELLEPVAVTDYASTFLPYGVGWGNNKLHVLLSARYWNSLEPVSSYLKYF